jgi:hypothetical protein
VKKYLWTWWHCFDPDFSFQVHHGDQEGVSGHVVGHGQVLGGVGEVDSYEPVQEGLGWRLAAQK